MLAVADLMHPVTYNTRRPQILAEMAAYKRERRVALGETISLVFEDRRTVWFQLQEMVRMEPDLDEAGMQQLFDTYGTLLPEGTTLKATLFVEIVEPDRIKPGLQALAGLNRHVHLEVGGERVLAHFEQGWHDEVQIAAVQFVAFPLTPAQVAALGSGPAWLVSDHPAYQRRSELSPAVRAALVASLA